MRTFVANLLFGGLMLCTTMLSQEARAAATPVFSPFVTPKPINSPETIPAFVGEINGDGFKNVSDTAIVVPIKTILYPLCLTDKNLSGSASGGWLGIGKVKKKNGKNVFVCDSYVGSTLTSDQTLFPTTVFELKGLSNPIWLRSTTQTPEPRGAIAIATQGDSGRKIFACQFESGNGSNKKSFVGYLGDDGKCYGISATGVKEFAEEYLVYVAKGTGPDATPRYGWVTAGIGYLPYGGAQGLAKATVDAMAGSSTAVSRSLCRVADSGNFWPGYVTTFVPAGKSKAENVCTYFTYFNNKTEIKETSTFEVLRENPSQPSVEWVVNKKDGKEFYFCTSVATSSGRVRDQMFGFTNNKATCTDGRKSTDVPLDKFTNWNTPKMIKVNFAETGG